MKKYIKTFLKHYNYIETDFISCLGCGSKAVDIHHITFKSQSGTDDIHNLAPLCRVCHNKAHDIKEFNKQLKNKKDAEFNRKT